MKKNWKYYASVCMVGGLILSQVTGCAQKTSVTETTVTETTATQTEANAQTETKAEGTVTVELGEGGSKSITYLAEDLDDSWDESTAVKITLADSGCTVTGDGAHADGSTVVIEKSGTYVLSGTLTDGQILIEAEKDSLVHLIMNGVEIANTTTSPLYASEKCKVVMTLVSGVENKISDGTEYVYESAEEDEPDAPVFVKGDLTINGDGELIVLGNYACGIRSKNNLMVVSGTVSITSADDGLKGKDSVVIGGGDITITSGKDGIKSNNDEDADKGYIFIDGGNITVAADDDGIQAETALIINDGSINVTKAQEALAGKSLDILGGIINAIASDDGINSAGPAETEQEKMMDQEGVYTRIAGGEIYLDASADGIDSNGDLYIEGGSLYLSGPTSSGNGIIDYNGTSSITGGTVIAAGSYGMMQYFGQESTQNYIVLRYDQTQSGGTTISLQDSEGNEIASYAPAKDFQAAIISAPDLETGNTYKVMTGESTEELTLEEGMTSNGDFGRGGMGGFGGGMGGPGGMGGDGKGGRGDGMGRPDGTDGQMPDGMTPPDGADGQKPEGMEPPTGAEGQMPEGMEPPTGADGQMPDGMTPPDGTDGQMPRGGGGRRPGGAASDGMTPPDKPTGEQETAVPATTAAN